VSQPLADARGTLQSSVVVSGKGKKGKKNKKRVFAPFALFASGLTLISHSNFVCN
jgi:hypothetical protein